MIPQLTTSRCVHACFNTLFWWLHSNLQDVGQTSVMIEAKRRRVKERNPLHYRHFSVLAISKPTSEALPHCHLCPYSRRHDYVIMFCPFHQHLPSFVRCLAGGKCSRWCWVLCGRIELLTDPLKLSGVMVLFTGDGTLYWSVLRTHLCGEIWNYGEVFLLRNTLLTNKDSSGDSGKSSNSCNVSRFWTFISRSLLPTKPSGMTLLTHCILCFLWLFSGRGHALKDCVEYSLVAKVGGCGQEWGVGQGTFVQKGEGAFQSCVQ